MISPRPSKSPVPVVGLLTGLLLSGCAIAPPVVSEIGGGSWAPGLPDTQHSETGGVRLLPVAGHGSQVTTITVLADSRRIVTADRSGVLILRDYDSSRVLATVVAHLGKINDIDPLPDGSAVATAGDDGTVAYWSTRDLSFITRLDVGPPGMPALALDHSPSGQILAVGTGKGAFFVERQSRTQREMIRSTIERLYPAINVVTFTPDGRHLLAGTWDGVHIFDVETARQVAHLSRPDANIFNYDVAEDSATYVAFNPMDPRMIATASTGNVVRLWRLGDSEISESVLMREFEHKGGDILALCFTPDGRGINLVDDKGVASARDIDSLKEYRAKTLRNWLSSADWVFDGDGLAAAQGTSVTVFDEATLTEQTGFYSQLETFSPWSFDMSPDGNAIAVGGGDGSVTLLSLGSGYVSSAARIVKDPLNSLAFSPDGNSLTAGTTEGDVVILDARTLDVQQLFNPTGDIRQNESNKYRRWIEGANFSRNRKAFFAVFDNHIRLWRFDDEGKAATHEDLGSRWFLSDNILDARLSVDGRYLVLSRSVDTGVDLWDAQTFESIRVFDYLSWNLGSSVYVAADVSPDGRFVAGVTKDMVRVWTVSDGKLHSKLAPRTRGFDVRFSRNGQRVLLADGRELVVWDPFSEKVVARLAGHAGNVTSIVPHPNGRHVITLGSDGAILIWDMSELKLAATIRPLTLSRWVAYTPEGLFDGSIGAFRSLRWVDSDGPEPRSYPVESRMADFYYPGLLAAILEQRSLPAPAASTDLDVDLPRVILSPLGDNADRVVHERTFHLRVVVHPTPSRGQPANNVARDLRLFRNGRLVRSWPVVVAEDESVSLNTTLELTRGLNLITAYAFSRRGTRGEEALLTVEAELPGEGSAGALYVVSVGISDYGALEDNLVTPAKDADRVITSFGTIQWSESPGRLLRAADTQPPPIVDREATKSRILESIASLRSTPDDVVVVYLSGHGLENDEGFYFVPYDDRWKPSDFYASGWSAAQKNALISMEDLSAALSGVSASRVYLIIDACYAGRSLDLAGQKGLGFYAGRGLAQFAYDKGVAVLAAAQSQEAALAKTSHENGYLVQAMTSEALESSQFRSQIDMDPRDGSVDLLEIFEWVGQRVPQLVEAELGNRRRLAEEFRRRKAGASTPGATPTMQSSVPAVQRPVSFVPPNFKVVLPGTRRPHT